jgi:hypothetical protein
LFIRMLENQTFTKLKEITIQTAKTTAVCERQA